MTDYRVLALATFLGGLLITSTLWFWGQPLICTCGEIDLWVGSIWSSGNSQHIADWYTLSHIVHGLMIAPLARLVFPKISFGALFAIAISTGTAWELVEHTDFVLDQFRDTTINQGYIGDSVLNAVSDYVFMMAGFFVGRLLPSIVTLITIVVLELTAAFIARDSLLLEAIMLVHRFEVIENWQQDANPRRDTLTPLVTN
ncbi:DUF2585 family protein [Boseongicola aestuarii]|uniref:Uncharacterized protein n=1 Tax=Boseongicola aestuarii TaxID=1470561 RepID=A0A238J078_9RHOB|nr:DUF2585 family protein [Boseongicola aestuarii]SMX23652.1 hypothetical protein BOA8489_01763 [Boseongicola aestuarii]